MTVLQFIFHCPWHFFGSYAILTIICWTVYQVAVLMFAGRHWNCELDPNDVTDIVVRDVIINGPISKELRARKLNPEDVVRCATQSASSSSTSSNTA